jgi:ATP adenylyltransferase
MSYKNFSMKIKTSDTIKRMNYGELREGLKNKPCRFCSPDRQESIIENERAFLTFAAAPYHDDHLLFFPKRHVEKFVDLTEGELLDMALLQKKAFTMLEKIRYETISFLLREGSGSGKSIPHIHYHVVPGVKLDPVSGGGDSRKVLSPEDQDSLIQKMKALI